MPQEPLPLDVANKLSSNNLLISKSYKCAICPSMFNQKTHLTTHIDSVHLKKKNYFCSKCDYAATRKGAVEKHVQAVHDKIKPFSCDMCALKFSQKAHMTAHFDAIHLKRKHRNLKILIKNYEAKMDAKLTWREYIPFQCV